MDENYPIDIHYNKLLDWLVDRRHCSPKWHVQSKVIASRVAMETGELPQDSPEIAKILSSNEVLNYFDCGEVMEILKKMDGDGKSLFGQYTAPRVKAWSDIMKSYEDGNVYLAECGQHLARLVNYELPALKHQINRSQQVIRDSLRKEEEFKRNASSLKEKFEASCKEMGINGVNVSAELAEVVKGLPDIYKEALNDLPDLIEPITFYHTFLHSALGRKVDEEKFLPMLSFILKNGNVSVYQWKHNEPPNMGQNGNPENGNETETAELGVDWGLGGAVVSREDDGIDFGEIDFGSGGVEVEEVDLSCIQLEGSGDGGVALQDEEVGVVSDSTGDDKIKYTDTDLQLCLDVPFTRNMFLDDLFELKEFLSQRLHEQSTEEASSLQFFGLDDFEMDSNGDSTSEAEMLDHVTKILIHMTNKRTQHLFLMKGSQRYLERLTAKLLQDLRLSNKAASQSVEVALKREQALTSLTTLQPKMEDMVEHTKKLQRQMAGEISKLYNQRKVNIMGEINQI